MLLMTQAMPEPQTPDWTLGWRLKRALDWGNVSAQGMAEELGVHAGTVSRWMNDKEVPRRAYLRVWALRCGVPLGWLLDDDNGGKGSSHNPGQLCAESTDRPPSTAEIVALTKSIPLRRTQAAAIRRRP